jgi:hypothetical protein
MRLILLDGLTSAAEAASASNTLLEFLNLDNLGGVDALQNKLSNAVALLHLKVGFVMVEKQDLDLTAVIGIDDTSACVNEMLGSEAGSRGNASICIHQFVR